MRKLLMLSVLVMLVVMVFAIPVFAQTEPITGIKDIDEILASAGLGVVIMLLVELFKRAGAIPDGYAGKVAMALGIVGYIVMIVLQQFQIDITGEQGQLVIEILTQLLNLAIIVIAALKSYGVLRTGEILSPIPGRD